MHEFVGPARSKSDARYTAFVVQHITRHVSRRLSVCLPDDTADQLKTDFISQLQWELNKIPRDMIRWGIVFLTLFGEGDAANIYPALDC